MATDIKISSILMLEHDNDDRYITQAIIDEHNFPIRLYFVNNSDELISYLEKARELPSLILLNQHSVPLNAVEILRQIKANPGYNHVPVVVLSGIKNPNMIRECYSSGASSFIQKPAGHVETSD